MTHDLVGKKYTFDDGNVIEVIQVKERNINEDGAMLYVTYSIYQGRSLPRKLVMTMKEFMNTYGHLFGYPNAYNQ
jgi:hypothetical protein